MNTDETKENEGNVLLFPNQLTNSGHVLVLDPDRSAWPSLARALDGTEWKLRIANSVTELCYQLEVRPADIIVLGSETAEADHPFLVGFLRRILPHTPVIVTEESERFDRAAASVENGARDVLPKPLEPGSVRLVLEETAARRNRDGEENDSSMLNDYVPLWDPRTGLLGPGAFRAFAEEGMHASARLEQSAGIVVLRNTMLDRRLGAAPSPDTQASALALLAQLAQRYSRRCDAAGSGADDSVQIFLGGCDTTMAQRFAADVGQRWYRAVEEWNPRGRRRLGLLVSGVSTRESEDYDALIQFALQDSFDPRTEPGRKARLRLVGRPERENLRCSPK